MVYNYMHHHEVPKDFNRVMTTIYIGNNILEKSKKEYTLRQEGMKKSPNVRQVVG